MGTVDLATMIHEAQALGLAFAAQGDRLTVTGPKTPAALALLQQLAQHKPAVIAYLTQPAPVATPDDLAFTLADVDTLPIDPPPPIRNYTGKPLLPTALWVSGLATFAAAWQHEGELCGQYATAVGKDSNGFYVRCRGWQWL